jgi:membrane protein YdbS with pleckstrin-like domain
MATDEGKSKLVRCGKEKKRMSTLVRVLLALVLLAVIISVVGFILVTVVKIAKLAFVIILVLLVVGWLFGVGPLSPSRRRG